jgi:hypothetical protein
MIGAAWRRWEDFWFAPTDALVLGLVRIVVGAAMTLWTVSLLGQLDDFFTARGVTGTVAAARPGYARSVLGAAPSPMLLSVLWLALLTASVALALGWRTRVASVVVLIGAVSLQRTNPYVFNSGDSLLRLLCLYLAMAPAGAALSLDARRRGIRTIPAWPLRLIQLQVSVMYLAAVWAKLRGPLWRDGTATEYALRLPDLERFPLGRALDAWPAAVAPATYGTILVEAALVVLVWPRRTRLIVLLAGVALHLAIDIGLRVGFFTIAVFACYVAFLDPAWARAKWTALARVARPDNVDARASPARRATLRSRAPR